jgi:hypothetical protein
VKRFGKTVPIRLAVKEVIEQLRREGKIVDEQPNGQLTFEFGPQPIPRDKNAKAKRKTFNN